MAKAISDGVLDPGVYITRTVFFFGLCAIYLVTKTYTDLSLLRFTRSSVFKLRVDLSRNLLATPVEKLQAIGETELRIILTNDIEAFLRAFQMLPQAFGDSIIVLVCLAYLAWLSTPLFLSFAVFMTLSMLTYHNLERGPYRKMAEARKLLANLYQDFHNLIKGSKELQLNTARGRLFVDKIIIPDALQAGNKNFDTVASYAWIANLGSLLFYLCIGMLLFVAPFWLKQDTEVLTAYALTLLFLIRPITGIMSTLPGLRQSSVSFARIQQLNGVLSGAAERPMSAAADLLPRSPLRLELRNAFYKYESKVGTDAFTLGPLNITIEPGEILFIVGGNGSGKTTLAMLLLGFYSMERGSLLLDEVTITKENVDRYRQSFSAVLSDFHLFEQAHSIDKGQLDELAGNYVSKFGLDRKIKITDGTFSSIDLSKGQRKRLALIAALLEDRPIYLFDEWAADQDPSFKKVFYTEILPDLRSRGKMVIVITHDDAYFPCADRVAKIENGQIHFASAPMALAD
jgi:putative ATP-binding cassette transporter